MTPPTTLPLELVKLLNVSEPVAMLTATRAERDLGVGQRQRGLRRAAREGEVAA